MSDGKWNGIVQARYLQYSIDDQTSDTDCEET